MIETVQVFIHVMFWLLVAHAVCDVPLQTGCGSKHRHRPEGANGMWLYGLSAHALIHAGGVALATGSVALGIAEFFAHWITDFLKCDGYYGMKTDQGLHLIAKIVWATIVVTSIHR